MAGDLKPRRLERIADRTVPLEGVAEVFEKMLRGDPRQNRDADRRFRRLNPV